MQKIYLTAYVGLCFSAFSMQENISKFESITSTEITKDYTQENPVDRCLNREGFQKNLKNILLNPSENTFNTASLNGSAESPDEHNFSETFLSPTNDKASSLHISTLENDNWRSPKEGDDNWRSPQRSPWRLKQNSSFFSPRTPSQKTMKYHRSKKSSKEKSKGENLPELKLSSPIIKNKSVKSLTSNISDRQLNNKNLELKNHIYINSLKYIKATNDFKLTYNDKFFGSLSKIYKTFIKTDCSTNDIEKLIKISMSKNHSFICFSRNSSDSELIEKKYLVKNPPINDRTNFTGLYFLSFYKDEDFSEEAGLKSFFNALDKSTNYTSPIVYVGADKYGLTKILIYMNLLNEMLSLYTITIDGKEQMRCYQAKESCLLLEGDGSNLNVRFHPTYWDPEKNASLPLK